MLTEYKIAANSIPSLSFQALGFLTIIKESIVAIMLSKKNRKSITISTAGNLED